MSDFDPKKVHPAVMGPKGPITVPLTATELKVVNEFWVDHVTELAVRFAVAGLDISPTDIVQPDYRRVVRRVQ